MELRVAEYKDYERIARLHTQSWQQHYQGLLDSDYLKNDALMDHRIIWQTRLTNPPFNQHVLVIEEGDVLCGFICAFGHHDFERGTMIDALHIDARYRGQGLGIKLVNKVADWVEHYFAETGIYLQVITGNQQAIGFYDHLGGVQASQRVWRSPCGRELEELIYVWPSSQLLQKTNRIS
ncbi:histone acetyltransferase [Vibrio sp. 10N.286.49.B3]|uniref:GNAT family N-acetyltransferase n=1 Tax=Vibrio sp. 10N.286.49.B3 TaxID=1880855 RepID=UPI000C82C05B|nr:GNAT family N-acetyltransferase [Vibrio sp. 10N.286.49.B3]PMH43280.1 histone acetyltransferase [Vibrio sp. 10N.286.49.B3]